MKAINQSNTLINGLPVQIEAHYREHKSSGFSGKYHYHDYYELIYCISGEFDVLTYNNSYKLCAGDLVLINTNIPHGINFVTELSEHYYIKFSQSLLFSHDDDLGFCTLFLKLLSSFNELEFLSSEQLDGTGICSIVKRIVDNYNSKEYGNEFLMRIGLLEAMTYIFRKVNNNKKFILVDSVGFPAKEVEEYIRKNYQTVTLEEVAEHFSLSYSYFSKRFLTMFGIPFKKYLIRIRVNESMRMLSDTRLSIAEIAMTVGFSSSSHYIEAFKKLKSMTPVKFRQNTKIS